MYVYFKDILFILAPLFIGSLLPFHQKYIHKAIEKILLLLVYLIILFMGIGLGQVPNLFKEINNIFLSVICFIIVLHACNIIALWSYGKKHKNIATFSEQAQKSPFLSAVFFSLQLIVVLVVGFVLGILTKNTWQFDNHVSNYALMLLLFLVGIQLKNSGIPMRQILLNKQGAVTAFLFITSSFIGGIICSFILNIPTYQALALSSGFGWYSLSGLILQESFGPVLGSIAFLNDMGREFIAFLCIPIFMRYSPCTAVGIGGATSLDFTLPIIQRSGGLSIVPTAISFGFIINMLAPIFLIIFSQLG